MNMNVTCDKCGRDFTLSAVNIKDKDFYIRDVGEATVQYFSCPACDEKYVIIVKDTYMKGLIRQRQYFERQVRLNPTSEHLRKGLNTIIKEQKKMIVQYKEIGKALLNGEIKCEEL